MVSYLARFEGRLPDVTDPLVKKVLNVPIFGSPVEISYLSPPLAASSRLDTSVKTLLQLMEKDQLEEAKAHWEWIKNNAPWDLSWFLRRGELKRSLQTLDKFEKHLKTIKAFEVLQIFRNEVNPHSERLLTLLERAFLSDVPMLAEEIFRLAVIQSKSYTPRQLDTLQTARELCDGIWLNESAAKLGELITVLLKLKYPAHHGETLRKLFSEIQELHDDLEVQELWRTHAGS